MMGGTVGQSSTKRPWITGAGRLALGAMLAGCGQTVATTTADAIATDADARDAALEPDVSTVTDAMNADPDAPDAGYAPDADASAPPACDATELVVNGSFELGPAVGSDRRMPAGTGDLVGWDVVADVDVIGWYFPAADGVRSLDLDGLVAGAIRQPLRVEPGQRYGVRFAIAGNPGCCLGPKPLRVTIGPFRTDFTFDTSGHTLAAPGWVERSFEFVATGRIVQLEFASLHAPDGQGAGPALDNVRVHALCP